MQKTELLCNALSLPQLSDDADQSCFVAQLVGGVEGVPGDPRDAGVEDGGLLGTVDYCLEIGENRPRLPAVYERQRVAVMHSIFPLY